MDLGEILHEIRNILLKQYSRSDPACYRVNKCIQLYNKEQKNGLSWKCKTIHRQLRRPLTDSERNRLIYLCALARNSEVSHLMLYCVNMLNL